MSADTAAIIDYRDLAWRFPELCESTYFTDRGGVPWFTLASLVITARMQGNNDLGNYHRLAEEIFDLVDWPLPPDSAMMQSMIGLLFAMDELTSKFTTPQDSPGVWVAVNVRSPSTVVFYYVRNTYTHPSLTSSGIAF